MRCLGLTSVLSLPGGQIKGPIAVFESRAYFGSWGNNACAVNLISGTAEWCIEMHDKVMAGASVDSRTRTVFFGGHSFWVVAVDAATGDIKWSFATKGVIIGGMFSRLEARTLAQHFPAIA